MRLTSSSVVIQEVHYSLIDCDVIKPGDLQTFGPPNDSIQFQ